MLKLGSQTGSLTNHLYSRMTKHQPIPTVGMGCTMLAWTDRHAATIVEVIKGGKYIGIQQDICKRTDKNGMSDCQEYSYTPNPEAGIYYYKQEVNGSWSQVRKNPITGRFRKIDGNGLRLGVRDSHHDYSF